MNKLQGVLSVLVVALSVACIGLVIALVNQTNSEGPQALTVQHLESAEAEPEPEPEPLGTEPWEKNVRLPKHLLPLHYDLYLHPDLESGLFSGRVGMLIQAVESSDYLLCHVKDLDISSTKLKDEEGRTLPLSKAFEYKRNEFWVVVPETKLGLGNYTLEMEFSGNLTNGITGFYKSVYTNIAGEKVPIATSKFQPTDARKAFPCFDEPSFKSTFSTQLVRPTDRYIALSNMPEAEAIPNSPVPGLTTVRFQKSVPMVTYLACFIVCDFEFQEEVTAQHGTLFRVYATPQQRDTVKYSLSIGANITDFFTNYFDIPYPLPKQDMIAIPDFSSGAMEHWGLITYRETNLLYDELKSSTANQERVAKVVSHELAHQWFGNLVTLEWWDDLWLNEGFASYMEYKGVAQYHDDWEIEDQFLTTDMHSVLDLDATVNSHAIIQDVSHPDQITEIFDIISYNKGASVLRMLESFMGAAEFRQGIHNFLQRYIYKNAVTSDLWRELEAVSTKKLAISKIMDTWTRQMGYPVLNVERISGTRYRVTQKRYLIDQMAVDKVESPYSYKWDVPVSWISSGDKRTTLKWLGQEESMLEVDLPTGTSWVKFNVGQFGYYRVNYPLEDWEKLATILVNDASALPSSDRASLLNDAFSLAESGHIPYTVPLDMTKYLKNEFNLVPWKTVYRKMIDLKEILTYTPSFPLLQEYMRDLVADHYSRLGWENTGSHAQKLNRNNIINLACGSGSPECNDRASQLFQAWIKDPAVFIHPNLRTSVYKYGMGSVGAAVSWDILWERYLAEGNAQEKRKLLYGLCSIKEPWILNRLMNLAKNETNVRSQDYFTVLSYINRNPVGNPIVWKFLQSEWSELVERFGLNSRYLGRMPKSISYDFSTQFQLEEVQAFFLKYPESGAGARSRKQAVERIQLNIKWLKDHQAVVHQWLEARN